MNKDEFKGKWHQVKGKLKEKWGRLTDQDLMNIDGKREQLLGRLQERYGWEKRRAEEELKNFEKSFSPRESYMEENKPGKSKPSKGPKGKKTSEYGKEYFRGEEEGPSEEEPRRKAR